MAPKKHSASLELSTNLAGSLDEQLKKLRDQVVERSFALAQERLPLSLSESADDTHEVPVDISLEDVSEAFKLAVGRRFISEPKTTFFDLFPPFTCLCFLLCLVFGALGLFAQSHDIGSKDGTSLAAGFLDIAKIFAGALVGSTASTVLGTSKTKKHVH
jgi:hypothetical protein